ncbi:rhomboid family intramembrane serine protease [Streptococcaceae bacterium ESL0687]|nr:rhomboid family intramembrane serine protease [Streptococcaceae bacterium ESL0687]
MNFTYNKKHRVTYLLTALTSLVFILMYLKYGSNMTSPRNLLASGALWGPDILEHPGHLWRLITPIFVHIGFMHFASNTFIIYFIGKDLEEVFGSFNYLILYLLSGVFGNAFVFCFDTFSLSAGASTSLFGIFAAVVGLGYISKIEALKEFSKGYLALILFNLAFNLFDPSISLLGHLGGALGGLLLVFSVNLPNYQTKTSKATRFLFLVIFVILLIGLVTYPFLKFNF